MRHTFSNFDFASGLTESMLPGNIAVRTGKPLEYNGKTGTVTNVPEAARVIEPARRSGREL